MKRNINELDRLKFAVWHAVERFEAKTGCRMVNIEVKESKEMGFNSKTVRRLEITIDSI